jgi:hypothetical protein
VRLCNLGNLAQIVRLQKEECSDGPRIGWRGGGALRPAMRAFWRQSAGIQLVAGAGLRSRPLGCFLGAALLVGVGLPGPLAENDDECFRGGTGWTGGREGGGRLGRQADLRKKRGEAQHQERPAFYRDGGAEENIHASPYRGDAAENCKNSVF